MLISDEKRHNHQCKTYHRIKQTCFVVRPDIETSTADILYREGDRKKLIQIPAQNKKEPYAYCTDDYSNHRANYNAR